MAGKFSSVPGVGEWSGIISEDIFITFFCSCVSFPPFESLAKFLRNPQKHLLLCLETISVPLTPRFGRDKGGNFGSNGGKSI